MKRRLSSTCNNCLGLNASHLKGFDQAWKTHVITLCDEHLLGYRDACHCMYQKAMGLGAYSADGKWKDDKWAQLYADRKAYIEQQIEGSVSSGVVPCPILPQKRAKTESTTTNSQGTQTEGLKNPDLALLCDEIEIPPSPDYALEAEAQMHCSNWVEQDPDEAVKRWNDALKPLPEKKKRSKYVFKSDE